MHSGQKQVVFGKEKKREKKEERNVKEKKKKEGKNGRREEKLVGDANRNKKKQKQKKGEGVSSYSVYCNSFDFPLELAGAAWSIICFSPLCLAGLLGEGPAVLILRC